VYNIKYLSTTFGFKFFKQWNVFSEIWGKTSMQCNVSVSY